jgi:hypothetical protein
MRWLIVGIAVLTFAIAGAGCGGGDDEASDTDTTAIVDTTTDETTTEDTETTDTDITGALSSAECSEVAAASAAIGQAFAAQGQADLSEAEELFDQYADKVPEELQDDVQVLADAYAKYGQALSDAGINQADLSSGQPSPAEAAKLVQAFAKLSQEIDVQAVSQAGTNLSAWANANCTGG